MISGRCVAIIPARFGSSRFPGKPLADLGGRPLVLHVVDRAREAGVFDAVWVATDDDRILEAVRAGDGEAFRTRSDHATGTERVAELAERLPDDAVVVNLQGDEPLVPPDLLRALVVALRSEVEAQIVTAVHACTDPEAFASPHVVKVVVDTAGLALYFSRAPIPHAIAGSEFGFWRHVGVYGFRRRDLMRFVALPPGRLECSEGLEQLRALEGGMRIRVLETCYETLGVDTPQDLKAVAKRLAAS